MTALPSYHHTQRAYDLVSLRMREAAAFGNMERAARIVMADLATGTKLISRALFSSEFASPQAHAAMVEIVRLLGIVGEDLSEYFIREAVEPLTPRELEVIAMDERSKRQREDVA
jgi:hypothetical protein